MRRLTLLLCCSVLPTLARGGESCVVVSDGSVRLKDLAPPGFVFGGESTVSGEAVLFAAPSVGATRWVSGEERGRLLQRAGLREPVPGICLRSSSRQLTAEELRVAMLALFDKSQFPDGVEVEVVEWSRYPIPDGRVEFSLVAMPRPAGQMPVLWRGYLRTPDGKSVPIWAKAKLTTHREVAITTRPLPAGHKIEESDYVMENRAVFPALAPAAAPEQIKGKILKHAVKTGIVLGSSDLTTPVAVMAGQVVKVEALEGAVRLRVEAIAETAGRTGETVWLHGASPGRRFRGVVTDEGQVRAIANSERTVGR